MKPDSRILIMLSDRWKGKEMCIQRLLYAKGRRGYDIANLSLAEIESAVLAIDGNQVEGVHLELSRGRLTIGGDESGRVEVHYFSWKDDETHTDRRRGILTDSRYSEADGEIGMILGGIYDEVPVYETVEKAAALQLLKHYSEHGCFPNDFVWVGSFDGRL